MRKLELVFASLSFIGLLLRLFNIPGYEILLSVALLCLGIIYFYFGLILMNNIQYRNMFRRTTYEELSKIQIGFSIGTGIVLAGMTLGILFHTMDWEGAGTVMQTSIIMAMILIAASIIFVLMDQNPWTKTYWYRLGPLLALNLLMFFNIL